ncbi:MAG: TetR/AcrR family transcriptional regulator [Polyangiaceae bacterium]
MNDENRPKRRSYDRSMTAEERAEEQKTRIVQAAAEVYAEKGYYETLVEDIAARATVSRRTIYTHFTDLDDVRFAVYERAINDTLVRLATLAMDRSPADQLETVLTALFTGIKASPNFMRVVAYELRRPEKRNIELRERIFTFFVSVMMNGTMEDVKAGIVTREPDERIVRFMIGAFESTALRYVQTRTESKALEAVPMLLAFVRRVYPFDVAKAKARADAQSSAGG